MAFLLYTQSNNDLLISRADGSYIFSNPQSIQTRIAEGQNIDIITFPTANAVEQESMLLGIPTRSREVLVTREGDAGRITSFAVRPGTTPVEYQGRPPFEETPI